MQKFIMRNATTTDVDNEYSEEIGFLPNNSVVQCTATASGSVYASFNIYITVDNIGWVLLDSVTISGTNLTTTLVELKPCYNIKVVLTAISGTSAKAYASVIDNE